MRLGLLGSFLIHFSFLVLFLGIHFYHTPELLTKKEATYVEVDLLPAQLPVDEITKKNVKLREDKVQVVDQNEKALNDEIPDDTRFLSQNNQKVKNQTLSQIRGDFNNQKNKKINQNSNQESDKKNRWDSFQPKVGLDPLVTQKQQVEPNEKDKDIDAGSNQSATLDYIESIDEGLETLLSTREFKYYGFYRRIRSQLNQHWTPKVKKSVASVYKAGRKIASDQDLVTRTLVILNSSGRLVKVQILGNSGFRELDLAALEALKEATPFINPPKGMIDPDGLIRIRWDFIIEG